MNNAIAPAAAPRDLPSASRLAQEGSPREYAGSLPAPFRLCPFHHQLRGLDSAGQSWQTGIYVSDNLAAWASLGPIPAEVTPSLPARGTGACDQSLKCKPSSCALIRTRDSPGWTNLDYWHVSFFTMAKIFIVRTKKVHSNFQKRRIRYTRVTQQRLAKATHSVFYSRGLAAIGEWE